MPKSDQEIKDLAARKYVAGKTISAGLRALSVSDLKFLMMGFGSGANPQALHKAVQDYVREPASADLSVDEERKVSAAGGAVIQLYSFLRDPIQQKSWGVGEDLRRQLDELERKGEIVTAMNRLEQHLEASKDQRGGKTARVERGVPPKGKSQSALAQLVTNHCTPKERSRAILVEEPNKGLFVATENFYRVSGAAKKDVENAARLASAGKMRTLIGGVQAAGVTVAELDRVLPTGGVALPPGPPSDRPLHGPQHPQDITGQMQTLSV